MYRSRLPYRGVFSLTEQLEAKAEAIRRIRVGLVHSPGCRRDLESPRGESLREGIECAAAEGWNVVNFDEFVFVPPMGEEASEHGISTTRVLHYYFFEPEPGRLMRAWKNVPASCRWAGGKVDGPGTSPLPRELRLRHYPALNLDHARRKYPLRRFATEDLAKG